MWKSRGRGGLTGRWTSSSCRPGRSKSCHSPIAGLHPCRPAGPTISGCPEAYCTSLMIELLSPWGRCRFSHENLTSSQTSSSCCPEIFLSYVVKILDKPWRNIFYHCRPTRKLHPQNLEFQGSPSLLALGNHPGRKHSILGKHHFVLHLHFHISELPVIVVLTMKNYHFESFVVLSKATLKK